MSSSQASVRSVPTLSKAQRKRQRRRKNAVKVVEKIIEAKTPATVIGPVAAEIVAAQGRVRKHPSLIGRGIKAPGPKVPMTKAMQRAIAAAMTQYAPHKTETPARLPDPYPYPTGLDRWSGQFPIPVVPMGSVNFVIFVIHPRLTGMIQYVSAIDGSGNFTYTDGDWPGLAGAVPDWAFWRLIGLRASATNDQIEQNRGGQWRVAPISFWKTTWPVPQTLAECDKLDFFRTESDGEDAKGPLEDRLSMIALPMDQMSLTFKVPSYVPSATDSSGYPSLFFMLRCAPGGATAPVVNAQITVVNEFIPYSLSAFKYDLETCLGDPGLVGTVVAQILPEQDIAGVAAEYADGWLDGIYETLSAGVKKVWGWAESGANFVGKVADVAKRVTGALAPVIVPFLGASRSRGAPPSTHNDVAEHYEIVARYLRLRDLQRELLRAGTIKFADTLEDGPYELQLSPHGRNVPGGAHHALHPSVELAEGDRMLDLYVGPELLAKFTPPDYVITEQSDEKVPEPSNALPVHRTSYRRS